ncbi:hypothetical protein UFOVP777_29 [uncultured Caudovirales phage]|uniref:Uncharacterized protein n=1 Tax=uncultured Caudovirales phage TaxID=2100421 RepID=A0A6J5NZA5_9CAUD|nr:hypothetical protein UFOVP777_29 [uncultured Caudovirales phage]
MSDKYIPPVTPVKPETKGEKLYMWQFFKNLGYPTKDVLEKRISSFGEAGCFMAPAKLAEEVGYTGANAVSNLNKQLRKFVEEGVLERFERPSAWGRRACAYRLAFYSAKNATTEVESLIENDTDEPTLPQTPPSNKAPAKAKPAEAVETKVSPVNTSEPAEEAPAKKSVKLSSLSIKQRTAVAEAPKEPVAESEEEEEYLSPEYLADLFNVE